MRMFVPFAMAVIVALVLAGCKRKRKRRFLRVPCFPWSSRPPPCLAPALPARCRPRFRPPSARALAVSFRAAFTSAISSRKAMCSRFSTLRPMSGQALGACGTFQRRGDPCERRRGGGTCFNRMLPQKLPSRAPNSRARRPMPASSARARRW